MQILILFLKNIYSNIIYYKKFKKDRLLKKLSTKINAIALLDVGAAEGIQSRWEPIINEINYIGIEPDSRSSVSKKDFKSKKILNSLVWSEKKTIDFYLCKKPMVSSCLPPNQELFDKFANSWKYNVVEKLRIEASTIDDELPNENIDFVKIDIQGGELYCLKGMQNKLTNCLGLELEVEFHDLYKNQPLFGDINSFLEDKNFEFIDFLTLQRAERGLINKISYGQCLFGDGLWLRTPEYIASKLTNKVLPYLMICSLYGRYDLALKTMELTNLNNSVSIVEIIKKLKKLQNRTKNNVILLRRLNKLFSLESDIDFHVFY